MRSGIRLLLGLAMSALGVTPAAPADDATVYTATYIEVVPPSTAQGTTLLRQYREASRKERGNLRIEVLQRIDRPNQFVVLAAWKDPEGLEAHAAAAAARDLRARLAPLLASPSDERVHHGLAVGAAPSGKLVISRRAGSLPAPTNVPSVRQLVPAGRMIASMTLGPTNSSMIGGAPCVRAFVSCSVWRCQPSA